MHEFVEFLAARFPAILPGIHSCPPRRLISPPAEFSKMYNNLLERMVGIHRNGHSKCVDSGT